MISVKQSPHPVQLAALPYRVRGGSLEFLLVTSRETRRWIVPKGWPMPGKKDHKAAAQEALEEAGIRGKVRNKPLGHYEAWKRLTEHFVLVTVVVFPLEVTEQLETWKEKGQRERAWMPRESAAALVDEPGLSTLIRQFSP